MCVLFSFNVLSFDSILDGKLMEQGGEAASSPSAGYLLRPIYTKMTEFRIGLKFHE